MKQTRIALRLLEVLNSVGILASEIDELNPETVINLYLWATLTACHLSSTDADFEEVLEATKAAVKPIIEAAVERKARRMVEAELEAMSTDEREELSEEEE